MLQVQELVKVEIEHNFEMSKDKHSAIKYHGKYVHLLHTM